MKKALLITTAVASGFLLYALLKRKSGGLINAPQSTGDRLKSHHITRVFANAKKKVTG